jgi:hypothetical protein
VRLDVRDRLWVDAGESLRERDDAGVTVDARRGEAHLRGAVVVHAGTLDDGVDRVAVLEGVAQPPQRDDADAVAEDRSRRVLVERPAVSVRRRDAALLVEVAAPLRQRDGDAARQRHVAAVGQKALHGRAHRDEGRRARGLDVERGTAQIELVGHARREVVLLVAHHRRQPAHDVGDVPAVDQVLEEVVVVAHPREDADRAGEAARVVACRLERLPRRLQE